MNTLCDNDLSIKTANFQDLESDVCVTTVLNNQSNLEIKLNEDLNCDEFYDNVEGKIPSDSNANTLNDEFNHFQVYEDIDNSDTRYE